MTYEPAMLPLSEPPDLMRRFVPTPHEGCIRRGDLRVRVRTNNARLLQLAKAAEDDHCGGGAAWTIVSDVEMPAKLGDPLLLHGDTTSFLGFGRACYAAVSLEKQEVSVFVSAGISDEDWMAVVLPSVFEVYRAASGAAGVDEEQRR